MSRRVSVAKRFERRARSSPPIPLSSFLSDWIVQQRKINADTKKLEEEEFKKMMKLRLKEEVRFISRSRMLE